MDVFARPGGGVTVGAPAMAFARKNAAGNAGNWPREHGVLGGEIGGENNRRTATTNDKNGDSGGSCRRPSAAIPCGADSAKRRPWMFPVKHHADREKSASGSRRPLLVFGLWRQSITAAKIFQTKGLRIEESAF